MPRTEKKIMDGWEFTLDQAEEKRFRPVLLPHDWAVEAPFCKEMEEGEAQGYRDRFHVGWYRKSLRLDEKKKGYRYYLDFGGIYEESTIWLNGMEAGGHRYGYSSFRLDVTDLVKNGENQILIRADNTKRPADRWLSPAGIYRTVRWIEVEEKHLDEREIIVKTIFEGTGAVVTVNCSVRAHVKAVLAEAGAIVAEAEGSQGILTLTVAHPRRWSAETPNLYSLTISLLEGEADGNQGLKQNAERETDRITLRVGLRDIVFAADQGMLVNGERVVLKGVCLHQDTGCRGNACKQEIWRERLLALKEMGCNAIRASHHTFPTEFLDLCDELGFYVYEECFDKWTGGHYGRFFDTEWKTDVECMVKRDRNRACIVIWGVGNEVENQAQASMLSILKMLKEYVLTMDTGRPVTYAMNPHFKRESNVDMAKIKDIQQFVDEVDDTEIYDLEEKLDRIKRIAEIVDVIACNYQEQWYPMIHEAVPHKLILGTEVYQYFEGHPDQMQNFSLINPSLAPFQYDYVIGSMIWTGIDYLGESMGYPAKGWSGAPIRTNGVKKPGYYLFQSYFSQRPMVHFSVMDYSLADEGVKEHWDLPMYADHWHFPQFHKTVIPYIIASNCEEVVLYLNDKRFYIPRPEECSNRLITGFLPYQPGTVAAIGYQDGKEVCRHMTVTPGPAVKLEFEKQKIHIGAEAGYELLLTVRAEDEEGNPYFRESSMVRFRVEGPGTVLAVDNGNLMGNEPYGESFLHLYQGKASVLIRLDGRPGRVVVSAAADGMQEGRSDIIVV